MNKTFILIFAFVNLLGCSSSVKTENVPILQIERSDSWSRLNSFEGIYVQDPGTENEATIPFHLTKEEQKRILRIVDSVDFWQIPDDSLRYIKSLKLPDGLAAPHLQPDAGPTKFRIRTSNRNKVINIIWWEDYDFTSKIPAISNEIDAILRNKPEYKKLPRGILHL